MNNKWIILIILLFGTFSLSKSQSFNFQDENGVVFKCKLKKGCAIIKSFNRDVPVIRIPSEVTWEGQTYVVNQIDTYISGDNYATEQIIIPNSVTTISNFAFNEFRKLQVAEIPGSLKGKVNKAFRKGVRFVDSLSEYNDASTSTSEKSTAYKANKDTSHGDLVVSDIDVNIPQSNVISDNTYCIIIANEHYDKVANVDYALRDGNSFLSYCESTLGVPKDNIEFLEDATYGNMLETFNYIKNVCAVHPSPQLVRIMIYYAGHGFNSASNKDTYILPKDGNPSSEISCIKLTDLYSDLSKLNVRCIMFFIDACFSGMQRGNEEVPLVKARTIGIAPRKDNISGNLFVFSATSSDETAMSYEAQQHGLFTYFLLRELQKTKGKIDLGRLVEDVINNVSLSSMRVYHKHQTPNVNVSPSLNDTWKKMNLKE